MSVMLPAAGPAPWASLQGPPQLETHRSMQLHPRCTTRSRWKWLYPPNSSPEKWLLLASLPGLQGRPDSEAFKVQGSTALSLQQYTLVAWMFEPNGCHNGCHSSSCCCHSCSCSVATLQLHWSLQLQVLLLTIQLLLSCAATLQPLLRLLLLLRCCWWHRCCCARKPGIWWQGGWLGSDVLASLFVVIPLRSCRRPLSGWLDVKYEHRQEADT
jgi:hypothetical protein